jgi:hypothetical protein
MLLYYEHWLFFSCCINALFRIVYRTLTDNNFASKYLADLRKDLVVERVW